MSRLDLIFEIRKKNRTQLDSVVMDATLNETHTSTAQVTDHPVEDGSAISDHIIQRPDEIDIVGIVSNTPIEIIERIGNILAGGVSGPAGAASAAFDPHRAEDAYEALLELKTTGALITITTGLRTYEKMAITRVAVSKDAATGDAVPLSISAREVRTVEGAAVEIDPAVLRAKPKKKRGRQQPVAADPVTEAKADDEVLLLKGAVNWAYGIE